MLLLTIVMADDTSLSVMPFFSITNHELLDNIMFPSKFSKFLRIQNTAFHDSLKNVANSDILNDLNFAYLTDDEFNNLFPETRINASDLSVFHINIRSLNKNFTELYVFLESLNVEFDVIVLSECWDCYYDLFSTALKNYTFYCESPCYSRVGGIGVFIKDCYTVTRCDAMKLVCSRDNTVENIWLEINGIDSNYILGAVYRHPGGSVSDFTAAMEVTLSTISSSTTPCILAGDINIDLAKYDTHSATTDYVNMLMCNNFLPLSIMPTRITDTSATIIDHIYYYEGKNRNKDYIINCGSIWCDITDHLPVFAILAPKTGIKAHSCPIRNRRNIRIFSDKNYQQFNESVKQINWDPLFMCEEVEEAYLAFESELSFAFQNSFPIVRVSRKRICDKKWITKGIKKSCAHKNRLYKRWIKTNRKSDGSKYKAYKKILKHVIDKAKEMYFEQLFDTKRNSIKQLWQNLNAVCSIKKKRDSCLVSKLLVNNCCITDMHEICNSFNDYFATIGCQLASKIDPKSCSNPKSVQVSSIKNSMFCEPVDCEEILNTIAKLKINKSPGPDNFGPKLVQVVADNIVLPLQYLINMSFMRGIVPTKLKIAKVIPVFKKGDRLHVSNYRPISLLNVFDKILEKLMYSRLYAYLLKNNLLYKYQFGFRKNHSTSLALVDVLDTINNYLDKHEKVIAIYLDLQKAFDTVDHDILLYKMYNYGIRGELLKWFRSYLSDRQQYVCVGNACSDFRPIKCGVPQGSVLGPLLFLIYVNDISEVIPNADIRLFADDTNVFVHGKHINSVAADANAVLLMINKWFIENKLSLSLDKTCFSVFGCRNVDTAIVHLHISNHSLKHVRSCKYLGVIIDDELSWKEHIHNLYNILLKFIRIFYKIRAVVPNSMLKMLYFSFIYPRLLYGIEVYGTAGSTILRKLKTLNNKLLRILQRKPFDSSTAGLYKSYDTLPIDKLYEFRLLLLMHNFVHHKHRLPNAFLHYFVPNKAIHDFNTRTKTDFHLYSVNKTQGQKCVKYNGSLLWNRLPSSLKSYTSTTLYKRTLKLYLAQYL